MSCKIGEPVPAAAIQDRKNQRAFRNVRKAAPRGRSHPLGRRMNMKPIRPAFQNYLATHRDTFTTVLSGIPGATDLFNGQYLAAALLLVRRALLVLTLSTTPLVLFYLGAALRKATVPAPAWTEAYLAPAFVILVVLLPLAFVALALKLPQSSQNRLALLAHHLAPAPRRHRQKS
jgi:hypothetical protein